MMIAVRSVCVRSLACYRSSTFKIYQETSTKTHFNQSFPITSTFSIGPFHVNHQRFMATEDSTSHEFKNRLSEEKSSYLLQHAYNPVDWYPWGPEAFEKAKKEDKLIFLSVGYSTCHWCHVMERESFENKSIAKIMNEHYVNIKVDREERPDVDKVYMLFVQAISGSGGWPMSVWLTPDLKPIAGGTYFPPDDRYYNRPGFTSVLENLAKQWSENKDKVLEQGTAILDALKNATKVLKSSDESDIIADDILKTTLKQLTRGFEPEFGGFSGAPKFPQPVFFHVLFNKYYYDPESSGGQQALDMTLMTLKMMAKGGIHDHVNKGFHRYSTDKEWHVPHFEKMLYDQAQLALAYLTAHLITKDQLFRDVCEDILEYVDRDLSDQCGGFYSAEDADSFPKQDSTSKKEGAFCTWSMKEIEEHLGKPVSPDHPNLMHAQVFSKHFNLKENGNVNPYQDPHDELKGMNVLIIKESLEDTAASLGLDLSIVESSIEKSLQKLYDVRITRPKPHLDTKMITSWNGLMISAFANAGRVLSSEKYTNRAIKAANFLKDKHYIAEEGILLRSSYSCNGNVDQIADPIPGFVDDYAFTIQGLIHLYESTFDSHWLLWAEQLQDAQNKIFWDSESHGYFISREDDSSIVMRLKEDQDGAEPSGNSVSVSNLLKLNLYMNRPDYQDKAKEIIQTFSERLVKIPVTLPQMVCGLKMLQAVQKQVIIIGEKDDITTTEMLNCINSMYAPHQITIYLDSSDSENILADRIDALKQMMASTTCPTAYVCENFACSLPVTSADDLQKLLS